MSGPLTLLTWLALVPLWNGASAQTPALAANINQSPTSPAVDSFPRDFVAFGGGLLFVATESALGSELWFTDGTPGGTRRVADIEPGPFSSDPLDVTVLPSGSAVFSARTQDAGRELWVTDGTANGTVLLADIFPGPIGSGPGRLTLWAGRVWFFAADPVDGRQLWSTDGTPGGTVRVFVAPSGQDLSADGEGAWMYGTPNGLLFSTRPATPPATRQIWRSDGSAAGTTLVAELPEAWEGLSRPQRSAVASSTGRVVFNYFEPDGDERPWVTDGSAAGTTELVAFGDDWALSPMVASGGRVYFTGAPSGGLPGLYETDGTTVGTTALTSVDPATPSPVFVDPNRLAPVSGGVAFAAVGIGLGREPWIYEQATGNARLLADVQPGNGTSDPQAFAELNGVIWMNAARGDVGQEVWTVGSGPASLTLLELVPGPEGSNPQEFAPLGTDMVFAADGADGREPHRSDGTPAGTGLLLDIVPPDPSDAGSFPADFARAAEWILFGARQGFAPERRAWVYDGVGALPLDDLACCVGGTDPEVLGRVGDRIVFSVKTGAGREPAATDGTDAGTALLGDLAPGGASSNPSTIAVWRGELYFAATSGSLGRELFATDGTPAGTRLVADLSPSGSSVPSGPGAVVGDRLYFEASVFGTSDLWRTDGTAAGTEPFGSFSNPVDLTAIDGRLYFSAVGGPEGNEPWQSDGTLAGTTLIGDIDPLGSSLGRRFSRVGDRIVFQASTASLVEPELFALEPSGALVDLTSSLAHFQQNTVWWTYGSNDERALFLSNGPLGRQRLWSTDGTQAGTQELAVIDPTVSLETVPIDATFVGDVLVLVGDGPSFGSELWASDGTPGGTFRLTDLMPGPDDSDPTAPVRLGDELLFGATDPVVGNELFSLDFASLGTWDSAVLGAGCRGASGFAPSVEVAGNASLGASLELRLRDAAPVAPLWWFYSPSFAPTALGGCEVYLANPSLLAAGVTFGDGTATLGATLSNAPSLVGARLWVQAVVLDAGGELLGVGSTSPVVELLVGP